jgi:molybdopterin synthase catalytic subunit
MNPICRMVTRPIAPGDVIREVVSSADGAVATFSGVVRDHHLGRPVDHLEYHTYPEMAAEELERIASELGRRFGVSGLGLVHRTGSLAVGETAVLVVAAAPHRREALACCAAAIEAIKSRLPVWKKEFFAGGGEPEWVFGPDEPCASGAGRQRVEGSGADG